MSKIVNKKIEDFFLDNYVPYSYYVIRDRALTSVDGLKPVQKRLIWTMWEEGLKHNKQKEKAQSVYGKVMAYHPHGDSSIADAGATLAAWFKTRVSPFELQGEVGHFTGDKATAPRYYELTLNKAGEELVSDSDLHAVEFEDNYDSSKKIPKSLPVRWPFRIINGGSGIAVGYASDSPPHNPTEVMNAIIKRLKGQLSNIDDLMNVMLGPDYPTGGELIGLDGVRDYYETGKGKFTLRGRYNITPISRGRHEILFYELPFQVSGVDITEKINIAQTKNGKLKEISEYKDLSDKKRGSQYLIITKSGTNPYLVLDELFKVTPLQNKMSVNNTGLVDNTPVLMPMLDMIDEFINFRISCVVNKLTFKVEKLEHDSFLLKGLSSVLVDLDKAIEIIRNAEDSNEANINLQEYFSIEEEQANYVLNMKLQTLTKSDKNSIIAKYEKIDQEIKEIREVLNNETLLHETVIEELENTKKIIADKRRTEISGVTNKELEELDKLSKKQIRLLEKDVDCFVYKLSNGNYVKSLDSDFKTNSPIINVIRATTQQPFNILQPNGELKPFNLDTISLNAETSELSLGLKNDEYIIPNEFSNNYVGLLIVTNQGNVNITKGNIKSPIVRLSDKEKIIYAKMITETDINENKLLIIAEDGQLAKFDVGSIRQSFPGAGTIAGLKYDLPIVGAVIAKDNDFIITKSTNTLKSTENSIIPTTSRSVKGSSLHKLKKKDKIEGIFAFEIPYIVDNEGEELFIDETPRAKYGEPLTLLQKDILIGESLDYIIKMLNN